GGEGLLECTGARVLADGDESDDLDRDPLSDWVYGHLHDGGELGGLQLRDARGSIWVRDIDAAGGGDFAGARFREEVAGCGGHLHVDAAGLTNDNDVYNCD